MHTEILTAKEVKKAADLLLAGEVVAFPTETVYGLGARVFDESAIKKIFSVKGRPSDNPLIAHIASLEDLSSITQDLPSDFFLLAEAFFPGPLTIICPRNPKVPDIATAGLNTIGVRMPKLPLARELISLVGQPLVAPSANLSGKPSSTCALHVLDDFSGKIAAVIESDGCQIGIESTVIQLDGDRVILLRPGSITRAQIQDVIKKEVKLYTPSMQEEKVLSPGMKYRHYAPKAELSLFFSWEELMQKVFLFSDKRILVLGPSQIEHPPFLQYNILTSHNLYGVLRRSDREGYDKIFVYCSPEMQKEEALMNRLTKAASL